MNDRPSVQVHVASLSAEAAVSMRQQPPAGRPYVGRYTTFTLTAADPVQCILEEDPDRAEAWVTALDNDIVIGTKGQVQSAQNTAASVPNPVGGYIPSKTTAGSIIPYPVRDCNAVHAGVTTTASSSRVSVLAYYRS